MAIYTKFGDKGKTALLGGETVPKSDLRVEAYGGIDELNAVLGMCLSINEYDDASIALSGVQSDLFIIGAQLASKGVKSKSLSQSRMSKLEAEIDRVDAMLPPLRHFVLPGGCKAAAMLHLARTVCRRVERVVVRLSENERVTPETIIYLNRLGDLLFVLARFANYKKRIPENLWRGK